MKLAMENPSGDVFVLTEEKLSNAIEASRGNERRRMMLPIQRSDQATVQRLVNILQPGSYVQPHHHPRPQVVELICVLRGKVVFIIFSETGDVLERVVLQADSTPSVMDILPGVWHTIIALEPDSVILEIKGGPYIQEEDKVFADWAPKPDSEHASHYLGQLIDGL